MSFSDVARGAEGVCILVSIPRRLLASVACLNFYRAMHFSAKRGIAIACRLSVRPSVCLSVCL